MTSTLLAKEPTGIAGWLLLIGAGLCFSVVLQTRDFFTTFLPLFTDGTFSMLSNSDSEFYHPAVAGLIVFEVAINTLLIGLTAWALALFARKSPIFPKVYIVFALAGIAVLLADILLTRLVAPELSSLDGQTMRELARSAISALIWIPYMLRSRRVRNTFVARAA